MTDYSEKVLAAHKAGEIDALATYDELYERHEGQSDDDFILSRAEQDGDDQGAQCFPQFLDSEFDNGLGLACPKCDRTDGIEVEVKRWAILMEDGTEDRAGDTEWENSSPCKCSKCEFVGTVADFNDMSPITRAKAIIDDLLLQMNQASKLVDDQDFNIAITEAEEFLKFLKGLKK